MTFVGPGRDTALRVVKEVASVIVETMNDRIKWPSSDYDCRRISAEFAKKARPYGMPNVVGCIDGSIIDIVAPANSAGVYVTRYGGTGINMLGNNTKFFYFNNFMILRGM